MIYLKCSSFFATGEMVFGEKIFLRLEKYTNKYFPVNQLDTLQGILKRKSNKDMSKS